MASINISYLIARSSGLYLGSACHSETRAPCLTNSSSSFHGLRSINKVDLLHKRSHARNLLRHSRKKDFNHENSRIITCRGNGGMNLVFVGAEVGPWSKTGGLGDVLGGLPAAMAANGHRVMTVSPRYDQYKDSWDTSVLVEVKVGNKIETVRFFHCYKRGVDRVFVDHPLFLEKVWGKTGGKIYGPKIGIDYQDNQLRFSLLCQAALEAPRVLNLNSSKYFSGPYGEDVVFIANDWHTGVLPCYLKSMYQSNGIYKNAKVAFCIHNMSYQGRFAFSDYSLLNLPDQFKSSFDFIDGYNKPVRGRKINWMKAGILESDRVLTVSPHYAEELTSGEDKGVELDSIVRKTGVTGIVNGMDIQEWNPMTDKFIDIKYNSTTVFDAKPIIKESLQAQVGLPVDRNIPVIGFIGRLEAQKGPDILAEAVPKFIGENVQLIALGTGYDKLEQQMEELEVKYPNKARGITKFNVPLAHMMIAGADFMIVPSRFEPCGLIQLQAMRYGTVPIVSSTGGLVDTVKEGYTGFHMGPFNVDRVTLDQEDVNAIATTVKRVIRVYGTSSFKEMVRNCMEEDLSWKGPAKKWEEILLSLSATGVAGSALGIIGEEIAPLALENIAAP